MNNHTIKTVSAKCIYFWIFFALIRPVVFANSFTSDLSSAVSPAAGLDAWKLSLAQWQPIVEHFSLCFLFLLFHCKSFVLKKILNVLDYSAGRCSSDLEQFENDSSGNWKWKVEIVAWNWNLELKLGIETWNRDLPLKLQEHKWSATSICFEYFGDASELNFGGILWKYFGRGGRLLYDLIPFDSNNLIRIPHRPTDQFCVNTSPNQGPKPDSKLASKYCWILLNIVTFENNLTVKL